MVVEGPGPFPETIVLVSKPAADRMTSTIPEDADGSMIVVVAARSDPENKVVVVTGRMYSMTADEPELSTMVVTEARPDPNKRVVVAAG